MVLPFRSEVCGVRLLGCPVDPVLNGSSSVCRDAKRPRPSDPDNEDGQWRLGTREMVRSPIVESWSLAMRSIWDAIYTARLIPILAGTRLKQPCR